MKRIRVRLESQGVLPAQLLGSPITVADVCAYLKGHPVVLAARLMIPDRVSPSGRSIPVCFYTDGNWIWSDELAEYVCRYEMGLPTDFLDELAASSAEIRTVSQQDLAAALDVLRPPAAAPASA